MITDIYGNKLAEGDHVACTVPGMIKGTILAAVESSGIQLGNQPPGPAFITIAFQVAAQDAAGLVPVVKIAGPPASNEG